MKTLCLSLLLVSLIATTAIAGTPDDPELTDPALDAGPANAHGDIESAWFEQPHGADTITVTIRFTSLPELTPAMGHIVLFDADGLTYAAVVATTPTADGFTTRMARGTFDILGDTAPLEFSYKTGLHGSITMTFARDVLPNGTNALISIEAAVIDLKGALVGGDEAIIVMDHATATRDFTLIPRAPTATPDAQPTTASANPPTATDDPAATPTPGGQPAPKANVPLPSAHAFIAVAIVAALRRVR